MNTIKDPDLSQNEHMFASMRVKPRLALGSHGAPALTKKKANPSPNPHTESVLSLVADPFVRGGRSHWMDYRSP